jgi:FMN phosphatase YigB (HAD superfamily)
VILDFFGTLVDVDRDAPTMADLLVSMGYDCPEALELLWNSRGFDGAHTPTTDGGAYATWREGNLFRLASAAGVPTSEQSEVVARLLDNDRSWTVKAMPGAVELFAVLEVEHIPFVICSNWDYELAPYLEQAGIGTDTPAITSATIGHRKPAPELFQAALDIVGLRASTDVWLVGDSWSADIVGAMRLGLFPVFVSTLPNPLPRHVAHLASLVELVEVLVNLPRQAF